MTDSLFIKHSGALLGRNQPDVLVLDEAHAMIKHSKNKCSKILRQMTTERRILLTGTPLQNNVTEYFQLIDCVRPGAIPGVQSEKDFEIKYRYEFLLSKTRKMKTFSDCCY